MLTIGDLPSIDAGLNAASAVLITAGWLNIRRRRIRAHRAFMLSAVATSAVFLACYLTYHIHRTYVSGLGPTRFVSPGPLRAAYLAILASHTVLALLTVPLVLTTLFFALTDRIDRHRRIARWTLPIWLYVSVTGVIVYYMLYHLSRGASAA